MKNICHNFYRKIIFNASALQRKVVLYIVSAGILDDRVYWYIEKVYHPLLIIIYK